MNHHTQFPTCSCKSLLCPHLEYSLLLVAADQLCKELNIEYTDIIIYVISISVILYMDYTFTAHTSISRVETVVREDWPARTLQKLAGT